MKKSISHLSRHTIGFSRMLTEVFTRKNFGERYFRLRVAIVITVLLFIIPIAPTFIKNTLEEIYYNATSLPNETQQEIDKLLRDDSTFGDFSTSSSMISSKPEYEEYPIVQYLTWYVFTISFLFMSITHRLNIERSKGEFDFDKSSYYSGDFQPFIQRLKLSSSDRKISIFIEPALFFISGMLLLFIGQRLGVLLIFASFSHFFFYYQLYKESDNFALDMIDKMKLNKDLLNSIKDAPKENTGPRRKQIDPQERRDIQLNKGAVQETIEAQ